ncbi:patatin-like phospholipase family protein [Aequorivita sp. F7]|nr:patatin-like phospholipase family protein [Aequorivita sp. F7]
MVFKSGNLIPSILASSAFPGIFTPVTINGALYIDGGVLNNFPVGSIETVCDTLIGSYVNRLEDITVESLQSSYQVANRAYQISLDNQSVSKLSKCDVLIAPPTISRFGIFDWRNMDTIFEIGYNEAVSKLQKLGFKGT